LQAAGASGFSIDAYNPLSRRRRPPPAAPEPSRKIAMSRLSPRALVWSLPLVLSLPACTVIELDSRHAPAGVEADGLIDGHVAFGWNGETQPLRIELFEGSSRGAVFELVIWKLFRFELGLAGVDVGLGPVDAGVGVLLYDPALPPQPPRKSKKGSEPVPESGPATPAVPTAETAPAEAMVPAEATAPAVEPAPTAASEPASSRG
jgi:hypothetical protein